MGPLCVLGRPAKAKLKFTTLELERDSTVRTLTLLRSWLKCSSSQSTASVLSHEASAAVISHGRYVARPLSPAQQVSLRSGSKLWGSHLLNETPTSLGVPARLLLENEYLTLLRDGGIIGPGQISGGREETT